MKLKHVIVSVNDNPLYTPFWDIIRPVLIERIQVKPILIKISDRDQITDYTDYIIHEIKSIPNVDTGFQAQISRLFVPKFYKNDVCLTSDIDMMLINRDYFHLSIQNIPNDNFAIYSADAYKVIHSNKPRYPMCYVAAKGSTFSELFKLNNLTFSDFCYQLLQRNEGWHTDELFLGQTVDDFDQSRISKLNRGWTSGIAHARIDRVRWGYNFNTINNYLDAHLLRPYEQNKQQIDHLLGCLL